MQTSKRQKLNRQLQAAFAGSFCFAFGPTTHCPGAYPAMPDRRCFEAGELSGMAGVRLDSLCPSPPAKVHGVRMDFGMAFPASLDVTAEAGSRSSQTPVAVVLVLSRRRRAFYGTGFRWTLFADEFALLEGLLSLLRFPFHGSGSNFQRFGSFGKKESVETLNTSASHRSSNSRTPRMPASICASEERSISQPLRCNLAASWLWLRPARCRKADNCGPITLDFFLKRATHRNRAKARIFYSCTSVTKSPCFLSQFRLKSVSMEVSIWNPSALDSLSAFRNSPMPSPTHKSTHNHK